MQHDFILLDRSGSMQSKWVEAMGAVNAYVARLAADRVDTGVTLAVFDAEDVHNETRMKFEIIRDRITPPTWREVSSVDAKPRGWTPLSDAIGKIVDLAERGNYDKVAIIIMTDGEENASRELSVDDAKRLLDKCRARNWQVIFLGASFDNVRQSATLGGATRQTVSANAGSYSVTTELLASKRGIYGATGQAIDISDAEKHQLNQPAHISTANPSTTGNNN